MLCRVSFLSTTLTPAQLSIASRIEADGVTLSIGGELDLASAPALERELRDAESCTPPRRIALDLVALDFIDSTGIHLLPQAQQRADVSGHQFVLTHVPPQAQRFFRIAGISDRLVE